MKEFWDIFYVLVVLRLKLNFLTLKNKVKKARVERLMNSRGYTPDEKELIWRMAATRQNWEQMLRERN